MRRKINFRLLFVTLAIAIVIGAAFHALHVWQVDRNVKSLLNYARDAAEEKKTDQALSLYEQYLKLVPADLDVQEEFALALDKTSVSPADRARTAAVLEGLLLKSGNRTQARARLIENLILLGRFDAAVRHLDMLRTSWPDPAEIEHKRGWCLDADGKSEAAAKAYQKAIELDPQRIQSSLLLAEVLHHRLSRDADARVALDKMVAANPRSATALLARSRHHRLLGREAEADQDLAEARRIAPDDGEVLLAASQRAQAQGQFDRARDLVARGTALYPTDELMIRELAALELRQGHREVALKVIEDGLKALDGKTRTGELQILRIDLLIDAGKTDAAAALIADLRKQGLRPALPDFLEARLEANGRKWNQAISLAEKARASRTADPFWSSRINALLGVCYGQLGDRDRQIDALLDAAHSEPRWAALNLNLGQAYLDADNPEQALLYLQPLLDDPDAPSAARTMFARARFRIAMQRPPRERRWQDIDDALADAAKVDSGSLDLALLRAEVFLAQQRLDAARGVLALEARKRSAKTIPDDLVVWLAMADLESRVGEFDRADEILRETRKRFGDRPAIRLGLARLLVLRGRGDDREILRKLADDASDMSADDRGRLFRDLAEVWWRMGDMATARTLLVRAAAEMPRDVRSRVLLVELDLHDNMLDDARTWLAQLQGIEGAGGSQFAHAALRIRVEEALGQPDVLRKLLVELKSSPLRRGDGQLELVEARILERLGDADRSLAKLIEAVNAGQRSPQVLQRLVRLLQDRKEYDQLAWAISLLEGRGPVPREVGRAAIETALATNNIDRARELLGEVDIDAVRDYRELLWLGRTYRAMNDSARAELTLRRAVATAPHAPDPWLALAGWLLDSGKRPQANDLIAELERKAPPQNRPILRARVQAALGNIKAADSAFAEAIKARPADFLVLLAAADFYRQTDRPLLAEPLYRKILAPSAATPAEIAARARRGLAIVTTSPAEAAKILAGNGPNRSLADDRLALLIEGRDPSRRAEAIRKLDDSLRRGPFTPEESFWFAQLLDADGQFEPSRARLDQILADRADTPQMLAFYARSLLAQGKIDAARPVVRRLVEREPDSPRARELQAQLAAVKK